MVAPTQPAQPSPPPVGTLIDNGSLELVQILGYGGYGIVYRAIDTYTSHPTSYAVKCLPHSTKRSAARQRQLHIREITLHQLASAHPGVVTLHRVIEDYDYTWIVMDYCPDGDLFTQILQHRRYLGNNELIRAVFLQLLDAVDYCHSLNIYHRDLKPENILCFENGLRLAITDFGLATTDRMSTEFRTGSVYHMSPECQGGEFAPTKTYSPLFNDIWSLGIILLNLITGRNPWKSASSDDCTFQAYLRDPRHFLPTVLPISDEVNRLLIRTLEVDWRRRITLREMRQAVANISNFYSPDVLFEDSMARCPWEAGVHVEDDEDESFSTEDAQIDVGVEEYHDSISGSQWAQESDAEMVFARPSPTDPAAWAVAPSQADTALTLSTRSLSPSPSPPLYSRELDELRTPSGPSAYSPASSSPSLPSPPATPGPDDAFFTGARPHRLTLDLDALAPGGYYPGPGSADMDMLSAQSSTMQTALESATLDGYGPYSAFFEGKAPTARALFDTDAEGDEGMLDADHYEEEEEEGMDAIDATDPYDYPASNTHTYDADADTSNFALIAMPMPMPAARPESPILGLDFHFGLGLGLGFDLDDAADSMTLLSQSHAMSTSTAALNWSTLPTIAPSQPDTPASSFLTFDSSASFSTFSTASVAASPHFPDGSLYGGAGPADLQLIPAFENDNDPKPRAQASRKDASSSSSHSRTPSPRTRKARLLGVTLNPVRLAFTRRSHSRSRTRSRSPGSSRTSSPASAQAAFPPAHARRSAPTHWTLAASMAPEQPPACFATPLAGQREREHDFRCEQEKLGLGLGLGAGCSTGVAKNDTQGIRRRTVTRRRLRQAKDWFSPGKLFAAVMPSQ